MSTPVRPVPPDLAELASKYPISTLCKHYRCGRERLYAWLKEIGHVAAEKVVSKQRPMPEDFPARALERNAVLMEAYGCSADALTRWRKECGVLAPVGTLSKRPVPDDFATQARGSTHRALAVHYGVSTAVIQRWKRETGVQTRPQRWRGPPETPASGRDVSVGGRAAEHLRICGWVVYRCTAKGEPDRKGSHYFVGTRVRTEDEMLQMAERNGFVAFEDLGPSSSHQSHQSHGVACL